MARTPDRSPGAMIEDEEIRFLSNSIGPTIPGAFNYNGSEFVMRDAVGNFNPRSAAGAFTTSNSIVETEFTASFPSGMSGSLTQLTDGSSYLVQGRDMSIVTGSTGQITISTARSIPTITTGTAAPAGGSNGDIYLQFT